MFNAHLTTAKIDLTKFKDFLSTSKWNDFKVNNLNNNPYPDKLAYTFYKNQFMLIFGYKELVFELKEKVESFLSFNDLVNKKIELSRENVGQLMIFHLILINQGFIF